MSDPLNSSQRSQRVKVKGVRETGFFKFLYFVIRYFFPEQKKSGKIHDEIIQLIYFVFCRQVLHFVSLLQSVQGLELLTTLGQLLSYLVSVLFSFPFNFHFFYLTFEIPKKERFKAEA